MASVSSLQNAALPCKYVAQEHSCLLVHMGISKQDGWEENITRGVQREGLADSAKVVLKTGAKVLDARSLRDRVAALSSALLCDKLGAQKGGRTSRTYLNVYNTFEISIMKSEAST